MKADIYLTSYVWSGGCIICSLSPTFTANLENEFGFIVVDNGLSGNRVPGVGRLGVFSGMRTATLGIYYSSGTVPLNTTVRVTANRTAAGVWSMTIGGQSQTVTKAAIADANPTAVFGNVNIPVYVGVDWTQYKPFSGYVSNVVVSGGTSTGPSPTVGILFS
jgi:hypothetical protein